MEPAVSVKGLSVTYRRRGLRSPAVQALHDLDLVAQPGEIIGVLGPNGSGKTTMLEVLAGTLAPTSGSVTVLGRAPTDRALVGRVGYQPDGPLPFADLSAEDLLHYLATLMGLPRSAARQTVDRALEQVGLAAVRTRIHDTYSTGMTRRLAIATALLGDPDVLLLDEPTAGLDPRGSLAMLEVLRERAAGGCAIVMASHHLQEVEQICDRIYLLAEGRCRATGTLEELLGTGDRRLVVRGLDEAALEQVEAAIAQAGGALVEVRRERQQLFALFRSLTADAP